MTRVVVALLIAGILSYAVFRLSELTNDKKPEAVPVPAAPSVPLPEVDRMTPDAIDFIKYGHEFLDAKKNKTIDAMDKAWKGKNIAWCGKVTDISETGTSFDMKPLSEDLRKVECDVADCGPEDIKALSVGQVVHVRGVVHSVSVLNVIVAGAR